MRQRSLPTSVRWLGIATAAFCCTLIYASCADPVAQRTLHVQRGDEYVQQKKYAEAIIEYRSANALDPRFAESRRKLADAYMASDNPSDALSEYVRAADLAPQDLDSQLKAGDLLLRFQRYEDARTRADAVLSRDPKNIAAYVMSGKALLGLKDPDQAIKQMQQVLDMQPADSRVYDTLGTLEYAKGSTKESEAAFRKAVEVDPGSAEAQTSLGFYLWATGRMHEGEEQFKAALALDPKADRANRAMAMAYLSSRRAKLAEPYLKTLAESSVLDRVRLADYYVSLSRLKDAREVLVSAMSDPTWGRRATLEVATIDYDEGRKLDAHKVVDAVLTRTPNDADALLIKARFLIAEGRSNDALAQIRAAADGDPANQPVHYLLGVLSAQFNHLEEAIESFNSVVRLNPRAAGANLHLANLYLTVHKPERAVAAAEDAIRITPDSPEAHLLLARGQLAMGNVAVARQELEQLVRQFPQSSRIHEQMGELLQGTHDAAGAIQSFERALQLEPSNMEAVEGLVGAYVEAGRLPDARRLTDARLQNAPKDSRALTMAGQLAYRTGDTDGAERYFKLAMEADASNVVPYVALAELFVSRNKLDEARTEWERVLERQPKASWAHTMIGLILEAQNKPDDALRHYQKALDIDPTAAVAETNLASIYADRGENLYVALQLALRAKATLPAAPPVNDTVGWVYYKRNQPLLAIPYLEAAVAGDASQAKHHYHLGMAYAAAKDVTKAQASLEQALRLSPSFPEAGLARQTLASLQKTGKK
jgi:tetratricopeptide (TPR) repeat protein